MLNDSLAQLLILGQKLVGSVLELLIERNISI